jgi:hypothetical protein
VPEPEEVFRGRPRAGHVVRLDRGNAFPRRLLDQHERQTPLQRQVHQGVILREAVDHEPVDRRLRDGPGVPALPQRGGD